METRIAILCSNGPHHEYLTKVLGNELSVAIVIVEPVAEQKRRRARSGRLGDRLADAYHSYRRRALGLDRYRRSYFMDDSLSAPAMEVKTVKWINDPEVVDLLRGVQPEMTIVMGTSVLHKQTLEAARGMIINIHGGYLPYYRGNHCFFFALYNGDIDKIVNHSLRRRGS